MCNRTLTEDRGRDNPPFATYAERTASATSFSMNIAPGPEGAGCDYPEQHERAVATQPTPSILCSLNTLIGPMGLQQAVRCPRVACPRAGVVPQDL